MRVVSSKVPFTYEEAEQLVETLRAYGTLEKVGFLDIETTGFSRNYDTLYLVGILSYERGAFWLRQILAEDYREEARLLEYVLRLLTEYECVVTYNGDMFDLPFLEQRAKRYRIFQDEIREFKEKVRSLDLLKEFRKVQSLFGWPDLKLKTVAACLGIARRDPFDGGQLIDVYDEYTKTNDERLEAVLLLHNYEDIQHLTGLMKVESFIQCLKKGSAAEVTVKGRTLLIAWDRRIPLSLDGTLPIWKTAKDEEPVPARFFFSAGSGDFAIRLPSFENIEEGQELVAVKPPVEGMTFSVVKPNPRSKKCYAKIEELKTAIELASDEAKSLYIRQYLNDFA